MNRENFRNHGTEIIFPKDFLFGVAASAEQIEGGMLDDGRGLSIWDVFSRIPGTIADNSRPDVGCNLYHRWRDDIQLMESLNVESYRFSISWPRVMPEGKGRINQKGLDFYKRLIEGLHNAGIVPNATLYHWDLPYELEREGGWLNRDIVKWYGEYASLIFRELGDSVPIWITINEPIAVYVGYGLGGFAPGRKSEAFGRQANHNVLLAHGEGVERFRQANLKDSKIGIVVDIWNHHPLRPDNAGDIAAAELENEKSYRSYLNPVFKGAYTDALLDYMKRENCMPVMMDDDMKKISAPIDFFGLNCYNRVVDCADETLLKKEKKKHTGGNYMDNGTEYYPKAVYDAVHILKNDYNVNIPIYITENGTYNCGEELTEDGRIHDLERIKYVEGFLYWISKAMEEGADIRGYYLWSLMDNWEWCIGFTQRYGIVHTDFKTQERICKDSALWYRDFIAEQHKK